jgi:hypothetical protein
MAAPDYPVWITPFDMTYKSMFTRTFRNTLNGATVVVLRKGTPNSADTTQLVSIGAGVTGSVNDESHPVAFAKGDLMSTQVKPGGTTGAISPPLVTYACYKTPGV